MINDDGGHAICEQILAWQKLLPAVKRGGLYILEDVMVAPVGEFCAGIAKEVLLNEYGAIDSVAFRRNTFVTRIKS